MLLRTKLFGKTYEFPDLRVLMGKANEEKSGDRLAGLAATDAAERAAARLVLAEVPLWALRACPAVPYEQDEVTRVIHDALNETVYAEIKGWTVSALREWLLDDRNDGQAIARISNGLTATDPNAANSPGTSAGSLLDALKPGPGGNIVYYRVD